MKVVLCVEQSTKCAEFVFQNAKNSLYSPLNIKYSMAYEPDADFTDLSFGVEDHDELLCVFVLFLKRQRDGKELLDGCGRPALFVAKNGLTDDQTRAMRALVRAHVGKLFDSYPAAGVFFYDILDERGALSVPGLLFLENGAVAREYLTCLIDLALPSATLSADIRKSYKSLIHWGESHLSLRLLDHRNIKETDMEHFRDLHIRVAGRETRSRATWDLMYEMIKSDEAFMIDGSLESALVTASFFIFNRLHCYYGMSASIRELFDKPLLHSSIWMAMEYAKKKGIQWFETGSQIFNGAHDATKKEIDISTFKRGFGGAIYPRIVIQK